VGHEPSDGQLPRGALFGAAALIGVAILAAAGARLTGVGTTPNPTGDAVERIALRFDDRGDGAVVVHAVDDDRVLEVLEPGTNGFARGVLRGLARARRAQGVGARPPFELTRWADGRLSLDDPSTGRSVELGAFGPTNAAAFADLWEAGGGER